MLAASRKGVGTVAAPKTASRPGKQQREPDAVGTLLFTVRVNTRQSKCVTPCVSQTTRPALGERLADLVAACAGPSRLVLEHHSLQSQTRLVTRLRL